MTPEQRKHRTECAQRIVDRLAEIRDAVCGAIDDTECKGLTPFLNGRGDLVIGKQRDVDELLAETPLAAQACDEDAWVESSGERLTVLASIRV